MSVTMKPISVATFQESIFINLGDVLAPVCVDVENSSFQTLSQILNANQKTDADRVFFPWAATAGINQYSLRGTPMGFLAKRVCQFRNANFREMRSDAQEWGDQVMGPFVNEAGPEYENNATFDGIVYVGPPRLVRTIFVTQTFKGDIPEDLTEMVERVDEMKLPFEGELAHQCYHVFHADAGVVSQVGFGDDVGEYDPGKIGKYCTIEHKRVVSDQSPRDELWVTAAYDGAEPMDFNDAVNEEFWREWALEKAFERKKTIDQSLDEGERIDQARLFRNSGEVMAIQLNDPFTGMSAVVCSNCYQPVAFCDEACPQEDGGCGYSFVDKGTLMSFDDWESLELAQRVSAGRDYF